MARFSSLKSLHSSVYPYFKWQWSMNIGKNSEHKYARPSYSLVNRNYHTEKESPFSGSSENTRGHALGLQSYMGTKCYKRNSFNPFSASLLNSPVRVSLPLVSVSSISSYRSYSSNVGGKGDKPGNVEVQAASGANDVDVGDSGSVGNIVLEKLKDAWQTAVDVTTYTGQKATEASKELSPHVQQFLDSHPYLGHVIVPVGSTLTATVLAWLVMPRLLRRFHNYASQSSVAIITGQIAGETYPYERSLWGALEDPVRYLVTFMAFSQIAMMVAPTTIASQYLAQTWRGAVILSFVWFLHRWKTNVFARLLAAKGLTGLDRDKLLAVDKLSSVGLFAIGIMSMAEACGVAVQSIMTVGGIGGVATAFASRDILGNVLSGLSMQFSKPFSLGDTIKAGSVEGRVVEMGLTTTSLLNAEKFPVIVPNSLFSSQVIVNKSRAQWRAMVRKIPLQIDDLNKIPQISDDIKSMLRLNSKVYLGMESPYCFLSQIESSFAELTIGCNLKQMSKDELYSTEQDIILKAAQIIKDNGASLGSTYPDMNRL